MCGCPDTVLEALLGCGTAYLGTASGDGVDVNTVGPHHRYNHATNADAYSLGLADEALLKAPPFRNGSVYESATGMEIGCRVGSKGSGAGAGAGAGAGISYSSLSDSQKETMKSINRSLRNVAWELTQDHPGSARIQTHVNVGAEGETGAIGEVSSSVVRSAPTQESFEQENERTSDQIVYRLY